MLHLIYRGFIAALLLLVAGCGTQAALTEQAQEIVGTNAPIPTATASPDGSSTTTGGTNTAGVSTDSNTQGGSTSSTVTTGGNIAGSTTGGPTTGGNIDGGTTTGSTTAGAIGTLPLTFNATGKYPLGSEHRGYVIFITVMDTTAAPKTRVGDIKSMLDTNDQIAFTWDNLLIKGHTYEMALFQDTHKNRTCVSGDANGSEAQWLFPVPAVQAAVTFNFTHNPRVASCQDFPTTAIP